ncbi:MAG: OmpA family protein [Paracoccaceae bacterium]|nr:OmpA family protein [Paracoccaceae bacterium]
MRPILGIIALAMLGVAALADEHIVPPDPGAPEGAVSTARSERPFDAYDLPVARYTPDAAGTRRVEGRIVWSGFKLTDEGATTAQVIAGYRDRLAALGFAPLLDCANQDCGGFDFRFAVQLLPPPAMLMDAADFAQLTASKGTEGNETFVSILVSQLLGTIHIQTVVVAPAEASLAMAAAPEPEATAQPVVLAQDQANLLDLLKANGHVPVRGLNFETGGAALTEDSRPALDALGEVLAGNPDLNVVIVGHSDNQGGLDANLALSKHRAEAVRDALVERGVDATRLEAHGVAYLAPITTNATEEGRAVNRRVELVLR